MCNFRHFVNTEIEIPESGLILIDGKNRSGKSTLFFAMLYAFYGKVRRPLTKGKTTGCLVELTSERLNLYIRRAGTDLKVIYPYPNGNTYDGSSAQSVINKVIGITYDVFKSTSYVGDSDDSVLSMSPADQTKFILNLAFGNDETNIEYKKNIKQLSGETKNTIIKLETELNILKREIGNYTDSLPDDLDENKVEQLTAKYTEAQDAINDRIRNINKRLTEYKRCSAEQKLQKREDIYNEVKQIREFIDEIKTPLDTLTSDKIISLEKECEEYDSAILKQKLYKSQLEQYESMENDYFVKLTARLVDLSTQFDVDKSIEYYENMISKVKEMKPLYDKYMNKLIKAFDEMYDYGYINNEYIDSESRSNDSVRSGNATQTHVSVGSEESDTDEDSITDMYTLETINNTIDKLQTDIEHTKKQIDILDTQILGEFSLDCDFTCPNCDTSLKIQNGILVSEVEKQTDTDEETNIKYIEQQVKQICYTLRLRLFEKWMESLNNIENIDNECYSLFEYDLDELEEELSACKKYNKIQHKIDNRELSAVLQKSKNELVDVDRKVIDKPEQYDDMSQILSDKKHYDNLTAKYNAKQSVLSNINDKIQGFDIEELKYLRAELSKLQTTLSENREKLSECEKHMNKINKRKEFERMNNEKATLETKIVESQNRLIGLGELDDLCKQAQVLAINNTIDGINVHSQKYIDKFWQEEPMHIKLENVKQNKINKDIKLQMNTVIQYNGEPFDSITELSASERRQAKFSFILGMNQFINPGKMLILDECLTNLDEEQRPILFERIREFAHTTNTVVYMVAHDAVKGQFDEIVDMNDVRRN